MTRVYRRLALACFALTLGPAITACNKNEAPSQTNASTSNPAPAPAAKPIVLELTPERLLALPALAKVSPMIFGEAPDKSYNWRFGSSEDNLMIWASFEPAWSTTEFSSLVLTSGYTIESDLAQELDIAAAILAMDRAELESKIMPVQTIGGHEVKVFGDGEFSINGLSIHYKFEDQSGVNGHRKPDLMIAILPESYGKFSMAQAKKNAKT